MLLLSIRHDSHPSDGPQNTWELGRNNGLDYTENWYEHSPPSVAENEQRKLMWDKIIFNKRTRGTISLDLSTS